MVRPNCPLVLVDDLSLVDGRGTWPPHAAEFRTVEDMSAATPAIGLLHHDADHTEDTVQCHLERLLPKIPVGGFVCLHDFASATYPGVRAAWIAASRTVGSEWYAFGSAGSLQVFKRWR
jgi:cephalosporin hydroxylase